MKAEEKYSRLILRKPCLITPAAEDFGSCGMPTKRTVRSSTTSLEAEPRYSRTHQVASYLAEGIRTGAAEGVEPCHNVGNPNLRVRSHECKHDAITVPPLRRSIRINWEAVEALVFKLRSSDVSEVDGSRGAEGWGRGRGRGAAVSHSPTKPGVWECWPSMGDRVNMRCGRRWGNSRPD